MTSKDLSTRSPFRRAVCGRGVRGDRRVCFRRSGGVLPAERLRVVRHAGQRVGMDGGLLERGLFGCPRKRKRLGVGGLLPACVARRLLEHYSGEPPFGVTLRDLGRGPEPRPRIPRRPDHGLTTAREHTNHPACSSMAIRETTLSRASRDGSSARQVDQRIPVPPLVRIFQSMSAWRWPRRSVTKLAGSRSRVAKSRLWARSPAKPRSLRLRTSDQQLHPLYGARP